MLRNSPMSHAARLRAQTHRLGERTAVAMSGATNVITTRMVETVLVNRLVIVTHMAHSRGHHWAIRPRQHDVCSCAEMHDACWDYVACIHSGVHMPLARKLAVRVSACNCHEAPERPETVASQPPKNAPEGRNLHR